VTAEPFWLKARIRPTMRRPIAATAAAQARIPTRPTPASAADPSQRHRRSARMRMPAEFVSRSCSASTNSFLGFTGCRFASSSVMSFLLVSPFLLFTAFSTLLATPADPHTPAHPDPGAQRALSALSSAPAATHSGTSVPSAPRAPRPEAGCLPVTSPPSGRPVSDDIGS